LFNPQPSTLPCARCAWQISYHMLRRFFDSNRRASAWLEARLPQAREDLFETYEHTVARYMNARQGQLVADVGGGKNCPFARLRDASNGSRIVAVDISADEISQNRDVDEARVADIMRRLPFAPGEVDLVVSRSVLEHLTDLEAFVAASKGVLKSGGYFIHLVPSRYAPFAVINRAIPKQLSKRIVYFLHPQTVGICGFPAFYDRCYHSALVGLLGAYGFTVEETKVSYYQSRYFNFFLPAYALSSLYELAVRATGQRDLGAYVLIVARKQ
jgi:SAM-dependent methyltransferase